MQIPRNALDRDPERLVRDYADLVLRVCYTYLHSTADAEDVAARTQRWGSTPWRSRRWRRRPARTRSGSATSACSAP